MRTKHSYLLSHVLVRYLTLLLLVERAANGIRIPLHPYDLNR